MITDKPDAFLCINTAVIRDAASHILALTCWLDPDSLGDAWADPRLREERRQAVAAADAFLNRLKEEFNEYL